MTQAMNPSPYQIVRRYVRPLSIKLRINDGLVLASRTLWLALTVCVLVAAVGWLTPIPNLIWWALMPIVLWLMVIIGFIVFRPLPLRRAAQRIDLLLNLRERLSTAIELYETGATTPLTSYQQADACTVAAQLHPRQLPISVPRRPLLWALLPLAALIALLTLPNPMERVLAERAAVAEMIEEVNQQLARLEEELANREDLTPAQREELQQILRQLQEELSRNPGDRQEALADIARAEMQLRQRLDPQTDLRQAALEQLARRLEQLSNNQTSPRPTLDQLRQQLENLANSLNQMSAAERQALADELAQQAAQLAAADPATAQALQDAAQALERGDNQAAAQALQQAAQQASNAQAAVANQQAVQQALANTQTARQQIAQAGQNGQGQQAQQGQGQQGQQAQGQAGQGQGQQGQTGQPGQGQQGQPGQGQQGQPGQGGGSTADHLGQQQSNASGDVDPNRPASQQGQSGNQDLVYRPFRPSGQQGEPDFIPGQQNSGGSSEVRPGQGQQSGLNNPSVVPYEQIFPEYQRTATEALDRGSVPIYLQDLVREYFSRLEP
jgi:uncharacterized protein YfkK (UPF0435 family)